VGVLEVLLKEGVLGCNESRDVRYEVDRMIGNNNFRKTETKLNELKRRVEEQNSRGNSDKEIKDFLLREAKDYWVEGFIVTGGVSSIVDLVTCSSPSPNNFQLYMKILHTFFVSSPSSAEGKMELFKFISQYIFSKCSFRVVLSPNSNIPDDLLIRLKFEKEGNEWRTRHSGNIMLFLRLTQYFINSVNGFNICSPFVINQALSNKGTAEAEQSVPIRLLLHFPKQIDTLSNVVIDRRFDINPDEVWNSFLKSCTEILMGSKLLKKETNEGCTIERMIYFVLEKKNKSNKSDKNSSSTESRIVSQLLFSVICSHEEVLLLSS
jgi:hypothetical protein